MALRARKVSGAFEKRAPDFVLVFAGFAQNRHKEFISVNEDP